MARRHHGRRPRAEAYIIVTNRFAGGEMSRSGRTSIAAANRAISQAMAEAAQLRLYVKWHRRRRLRRKRHFALSSAKRDRAPGGKPVMAYYGRASAANIGISHRRSSYSTDHVGWRGAGGV